MSKNISKLVLLAGIFLISCNKSESDANKPINVYIETEAWKADLVKSKRIGTSCEYADGNEDERLEWAKNNPNQSDGLPANDNDYYFELIDLDNSGKNDVLFYFNAVNCTGHNGDTPTFAKIMYANGKQKTDILPEIITAIQKEFNKQKADNNWSDVTNNFMENTTKITGYNNGITGKFLLYTKDDAHCCPTYSGSYTYSITDKEINIDVAEM